MRTLTPEIAAQLAAGRVHVALLSELGTEPEPVRVWTGIGDLTIAPLPALTLDFRTGVLDPRIVFARASVGMYFDIAGVLRTAAVNIPRFDHDPVTHEALGLLVEGGRSNAFLWSEDLTQAAWLKTAATISANVVAAPDGLLTADKVVQDVQNGIHAVTQNGIAINTAYAVSCFAKAAEETVLVLANDQTGTATFNLVTGVASAVVGTAKIVPLLNGWYRCEWRFTSSGTAGAGLRFNLRQNGSFQGDGIGGLYLWGAQLEAAEFSSSYIPTAGAAASRAADIPTLPVAGWWNAAAGTFLIDYDAFSNKLNRRQLLVGTDGGLNRLAVRADEGGVARVPQFVVGNGSVNASVVAPVDVPAHTRAQVVGAYSASDHAFAASGQVTSGATGFLYASDFTAFQIGHNGGGGLAGQARIRRIIYWPVRLPNAALGTLSAGGAVAGVAGLETTANIVFRGVGTAGMIGPVRESGGEVRANALTLQLSGIPSELLSVALTTDYQGRDVRLWLALFDEAGSPLADPVLLFRGRMDVMQLDEGPETSTLTVSAESRLADLTRPRERRYTDQDQQQLFPGDKGLEFVIALQNKELIWGAAATSPARPLPR